MAKVKKITVANLKAISELTADFDGCTAIITGGNNKGKSSFLRSLPDRLRQVKPNVILKEGEEEGFAEWELTTGERFIWNFDNKTKKGEKLTFITKDNIKTSLTREIADRYFPKTFDIDRFLNVGPREQKKILQSIVGIDFDDIDRRYKEAYDNRTTANRIYERDRQNKIEPYDNVPEEAVDVEKLKEEIRSIDVHNQRFSHVMEKMDLKEKNREEHLKEIEELEQKIISLKESVKELDEDIKKGSDWLLDPKNAEKTQFYRSELESELEKAEETNRKVTHNERVKEQDIKISVAQNEAKEADDIVKSIEKERIDLVRSADLPVGFGFTDEGVTYLGHPLTKEQLSSSAIYIAALKLASLNLGEVKTLHFDASFLDKNSLEEIESWANQNDLQLLIERPDFDGGEIEYQLINKSK